MLIGKILKSYTDMKRVNPSLSLRALSLKLKISSGALSEILHEKRSVTPQTAKKILTNLKISPPEIDDFFEGNVHKKKLNESSKREYQALKMEQYEILSNPIYLSLLNLIEINGESHRVASLAKRLGKSHQDTQEAIDRLLKLDLITKSHGRFHRTLVRLKTTDDISSSAIKKFHSDSMKSAEKSLYEIEPVLRDFSAIIVKFDPKKMDAVKELIKDFQDQLADLVDNESSQEIYQLNVHLYPLTQLNTENKKQQPTLKH